MDEDEQLGAHGEEKQLDEEVFEKKLRKSQKLQGTQNADVLHGKQREKRGGLQKLQHSACKMEAQPDVSEPGHTPPFTPDQGSQIEERFLAFLRGYKVNGHQYYKTISSALASINSGDMSIRYAHLQQFDPILANTIHIFFGSVQTNLANAAKVFLKEVVGFQCENPVVKISERPKPCSFMLLKDLWGLPEHRPSEECDIYCGEMVLNITKQPWMGE